MKSTKKMNVLTYILLIPIALFAFFPFYVMLKSAFEPLSQIVSGFHFFPGNGLYLENFKEVFASYPIARWFFNSVTIAVVAVLGNLIFCPLVAYALAKVDFRGRKLLFILVVATLIIPVQILVVPLYLMLAPLGLSNTFIAIILPDLVSPFGIFLLRQAFLGIPKELEEAAFIDGCGRIRSLFRIVLPNAIPTLFTIAVLKFMWVWGDFMWPSLMLTKEAMKTLPVGIASFQTTSSLVPWGMVISASVISVIPILLLFFFLQKYFVKGLTDGAVKG
ncbi:carbohydrate ABC transporter permease [Terribacillus saccharophilus]|uniref:carbohydrate ABC transporter permease n=1 Tax=Terribacillus saccharophilus TaxID=361277 RepID=UPI00398217F1